MPRVSTNTNAPQAGPDASLTTTPGIPLATDGVPRVGPDGTPLLTDQSPCCCGGSECALPVDPNVCMTLDLFLNPSNRVWMRGATAQINGMSGFVSWSLPEPNDIISYVLLNPNDDSLPIPLGPLVQRDAGGCARLVGFQGPARFRVYQYGPTQGTNPTTMNVCVIVRMTTSGWALSMTFLDSEYASAVWTWERNQLNQWDDGAIYMATNYTPQHRSTISIPGFGRPMASADVSATCFFVGSYGSVPNPGDPLQDGCPPPSGASTSITVKPLKIGGAYVICTPGTVTVPGRYRMTMELSYRAVSSVTASGIGKYLSRTEDTHNERQVIEFRNPVGVGETALLQTEWSGGGTFTNTLSDGSITQGTYPKGGLIPPGAVGALSAFVDHVQMLPYLYGVLNIQRTQSVWALTGQYYDGYPTWLWNLQSPYWIQRFPCSGSWNGQITRTYPQQQSTETLVGYRQWSAIDSQTRREVSQTRSDQRFYTAAPNINIVEKYDVQVSFRVFVEPIDDLLCANTSSFFTKIHNRPTLNDIAVLLNRMSVKQVPNGMQ